jgi:polysaccharide export outer membrane protein
VNRLFFVRSLRRAAAALALALLAGTPLAAQADPQAGVLGPGDLLRITVHQRTDLSGEIEVGDDGALLHPLYRDVQVAGLTRAELDARLSAFLRRYQETPAFVAEPLVRVTVAGEVRQPGTVTVRPGTTLFQALAQAGGAGERGRISRVQLMRGQGSTTYDLSRPDAPGAREPVRTGDVVVVPRRPANLREYVAPVASVMAVVVSVVNLIRTANR